MGIELTDKELSGLMNNLPVDSEYFKLTIVIRGILLLDCANME